MVLTLQNLFLYVEQVYQHRWCHIVVSEIFQIDLQLPFDLLGTKTPSLDRRFSKSAVRVI